MKLIDVYSTNFQYEVLFDLLRERQPHESISHKAMPTWEQHCQFVASRPYAHWYLIPSPDGDPAGAIYLTHEREIGVGVLKMWRGIRLGTAAITELMRLHPGRFLANIAPNNAASIALFRKLGFGPEPIQITLEKTWTNSSLR